jgi:small-conductance mechanosensitive channel
MPRLGSTLQVLAAPDDECFEDPSRSVCSWVYRHTDNNATLARIANWLIDRPLQVILVLVTAWLVAKIARLVILRSIPRFVDPRKDAVAKLSRYGVPIPGSFAARTTDSRRRARVTSIARAAASTVTVIVWVIALVLILAIVDIKVGPLVAGAGIAGVALGFGAQSLVKDCIAGIFMLIEDQYGIGDIVDVGEATGTIESIALRTTVLRSADGTVWHVPNGVIQRVGNMSQQWSVAVLDVEVAYDTDIELASASLLTAANQVCTADEYQDQVLEAPTLLGVEAVGATAITLRLTTKVKPGAQFRLQRALREHVKVAFDAAGIKTPAPQFTVNRDAQP